MVEEKITASGAAVVDGLDIVADAAAEATDALRTAGATGAVADLVFPCGREGVLALLPHRDPFVWVSRIVACEPGKHIVAELDVDPDLPLFEGHFPGKPVLPGVIIMEALAQASCCCIMASQAYAGSVGLFAAMDKVKFQSQVLPGQTLVLESTIVKSGSRMCAAEVVARIGDTVCAEAMHRYVIDRSGTSQNSGE